MPDTESGTNCAGEANLMNDSKKNLKGSEKRDVFKWAHKNQGNMSAASFYAADADLCLLSTKPRGVVAYIDYKGGGEGITFTEKILYDEWVERRPVYIVEGSDPLNGPFKIFRYKHGGETQFVIDLSGWDDYMIWEAELRREYFKNNGQHTP